MNGRSHVIEVMHGVNLDQLGHRDPQLYGTLTLAELEQRIEADASELGLRTRFFHTNHEGAFVEHLHGLRGEADAVVLNPGAWTHYAWAIRDALEIAALPAVEVHLSSTYRKLAISSRSQLPRALAAPEEAPSGQEPTADAGQ